MKLFEFEAKNILRKYGIQTPKGNVAHTPEEARLAAEKIGKPVAIKSQILVSGRGKSGGILFGNSAAEARKLAARLIGQKVSGATVSDVLIEEKVDIMEELYASVTIDRQAKRYVVLASLSGGIDIEQIALAFPGKISRYHVDSLAGFSQQVALEMLSRFSSLEKSDLSQFASVIHTLYHIAQDCDAELAEINPLVRTASGQLVACDARIIIDDNALFRHPEFGERDSSSGDYTALEARARQEKLAYVELDGDIGIIGNGAGLVMATLDMVHLFGGKPANFLDIGGGASAEVIKKAVSLVTSKPEVRAVLINILGGVTRCDVVARGVVEGLRESAEPKPVSIRMIGTNEKEGVQMLRRAGIRAHSSMEEAIKDILK